MYVSDYFLKLHNSKKDTNVKLSAVPVEFINLLNDVLNRSKDNEIKKIEDLTIKEIKLLFNNLMSIKFNQVQDGVSGNNMIVGPFLQNITSLAENSSVSENITINELFNKEKQNKSNEIQQFQDKLNNFSNIEITDNTKINSIEDFVINILNLKSEDFGKDGFKTFDVEFPGHVVTIVIDTSKSYEEFIENNKDMLKDIIMIDSSKAVNWMVDVGMLKFSDPNTQNFIRKLPVPNISYQENGTCWGNATCANSALLNNYKSFNEIVKRNEEGKLLDYKMKYKKI